MECKLPPGFLSDSDMRDLSDVREFLMLVIMENFVLFILCADILS